MKLTDADVKLDAAQKEYSSVKRNTKQLDSDFVNMLKVMSNKKCPVSLKTDQIQLVYNNICKLRDELKRLDLMTAEKREKLDRMRNVTKLANDYALGYIQGSFCDDPSVNVFLNQYTDIRDSFKGNDIKDIYIPDMLDISDKQVDDGIDL